MYNSYFSYCTILFVCILSSCNLLNNRPDFPEPDTDINKRILPIVDFDDRYVDVLEAADGASSRVEISISCDSILYSDIQPTITVAADNSHYKQENRAVEGVDFRFVGSKTLCFDTKYPICNIVIETIDNDLATGDKVFDIVVVDTIACSYTSQPRCVVTILDDDNEPRLLSGDYRAYATSCVLPDNYVSNEAWTLSLLPDVTCDSLFTIAPVCQFLGVKGSSIYPVKAAIDYNSKSVAIPYGQTLLQGATSQYILVGCDDGSTPILDGVAVAHYDIADNRVTIAFEGNYAVVNILSDKSEKWMQIFENPVFIKEL